MISSAPAVVVLAVVEPSICTLFDAPRVLVTLREVAREVTVAAAADAPPITVPSSVPPLMSAVVTVPRSVQVAPAAVGDVVIVGEAIVGLVPKTATPVPVSSEREARRAADAPVVARLDEPSVVTNLDAVRAVAIVPENVGPAIVGLVPKTRAPEPVSSETEAATLADVPVDIRFLLASVKTSCEAVNPWTLRLPAAT